MTKVYRAARESVSQVNMMKTTKDNKMIKTK